MLSTTNPGFAMNLNSAQTKETVIGALEEKMYCSATLEDNFEDDKVIVVLTNSESLKFNSYSAANFPEISCISVDNLTLANTALMEAKMSESETASLQNAVVAETEIETNRFHQILILTLAEPGKQKVLDAIKTLEARPDVLSAEPNYVISLVAPLDSINVEQSTLLSSTATTSAQPDDPYNQQWVLNKIKLPQAWEITTGSNSINVGILDTGIDTSIRI